MNSSKVVRTVNIIHYKGHRGVFSVEQVWAREGARVDDVDFISRDKGYSQIVRLQEG